MDSWMAADGKYLVVVGRMRRGVAQRLPVNLAGSAARASGLVPFASVALSPRCGLEAPDVCSLYRTCTQYFPSDSSCKDALHRTSSTSVAVACTQLQNKKTGTRCFFTLILRVAQRLQAFFPRCCFSCRLFPTAVD